MLEMDKLYFMILFIIASYKSEKLIDSAVNFNLNSFKRSQA